MGLWIAFDLLVGTGFACGGWAFLDRVYFQQREISRFVRPLLASLFGYSLVVYLSPLIWGVIGIALFLHSGQFNTNSVLFETAFCMTVYIIVVTLGVCACMAWFPRFEEMV